MKIKFNKPNTEWHEVFALLPKLCTFKNGGFGIIWMEVVERRDIGALYEYREKR